MTQIISYDQALRQHQKIRGQRAEARNIYDAAMKAAADAKHDFRKAKATAHVTAAAEGGTAELKKARAEELAADAEKAQGYRDAAVKIAADKLSELEGEREMLRSFMSWSQKLNAAGIE